MQRKNAQKFEITKYIRLRISKIDCERENGYSPSIKIKSNKSYKSTNQATQNTQNEIKLDANLQLKSEHNINCTNWQRNPNPKSDRERDDRTGKLFV